ncbi:MAG TPA: hydrogenase maturation protease [Rhodocyclaceae bacterium]|nr:hydrogenase maturation protease [Rhodocyclaceae bacterium]
MTEGVRVVVIAVGNPSRGDDALGPLLLERIAARFGEVVAVADFQLQIEHALLLEEADLALFIDAATGLEASCAFDEIGPERAATPLTHALAPQAVLGVFERIAQRAPPPAFVLGLRAAHFGLGEAPSAAAREALAEGWRLAGELLADARPARWRAVVAARGGAGQWCGSGNSSAR